MPIKLTTKQEKILNEKLFLEKEEISISDLMNKTREMMTEQSVSRESEVAYFYFFFTFFSIFTGFIVIWYLATRFTSLSEYFNSIFCNSKKYPGGSKKY